MTQGERVREIRKALGLTLEKFGEKLGVGKTAISKLEKNERNLTDQMVKAICREYNVSSMSCASNTIWTISTGKSWTFTFHFQRSCGIR